MNELTKRQSEDLQAFHDDQMKQMQGPTTAEIISFLREEVITMTLAECDTTYMVIAAADRLEQYDEAIQILASTGIALKEAEAKLDNVHGLFFKWHALSRMDLGDSEYNKGYMTACATRANELTQTLKDDDE